MRRYLSPLLGQHFDAACLLFTSPTTTLTEGNKVLLASASKVCAKCQAVHCFAHAIPALPFAGGQKRDTGFKAPVLFWTSCPPPPTTKGKPDPLPSRAPSPGVHLTTARIQATSLQSSHSTEPAPVGGRGESRPREAHLTLPTPTPHSSPASPSPLLMPPKEGAQSSGSALMLGWVLGATESLRC